MPKENLNELIVISPFSPELDAIKREDPARNQIACNNNQEMVSNEAGADEDQTIPKDISYPGFIEYMQTNFVSFQRTERLTFLC